MSPGSQEAAPLQLPPGWPPPASKLEVVLRYVVLLGWPFASALAWRRLGPLRREFENVLSARPEPPPEVWGDGPARRALALELCQALAERAPWPTARFFPQDSFAVAMDWYWGDGNEMEVIVDIEEIVGARIGNEGAERLRGMTMAEAVECLFRMRIQANLHPRRSLVGRVKDLFRGHKK